MALNFFFVEFYASQQNVDDGSSVVMPMINVSVSVANIFDHSPTAADHGYHSFEELASFIYCLLQEYKIASSLALVEQ